MYLAYSLLLSLGLLLLSPYFLFQALAHRKYVSGLRERLGFLPAINQQPVVWLHCVSVGETQAARPLVERLRRELPQHALVVSTVTLTGQKLARELFRTQAARVFYFPFDWRWSVRRALRAMNPAVVLVMETELWPNFLRECKAREIPVALVNGRISRKSFARYRRIKFFLRRVFECVTVAVMQSEKDAERLRELGAKKVVVAGNLKFDVGLVEGQTDLACRFGLNGEVPLVVAASTHAPEETIVLESFANVRQSQPLRLMLAPRRPERFNEVAKLIEASGLSWARRTSAPAATDANVEVILLDTIGELPATYSLATAVFVGGSIVDLLNAADAIVQLPPSEDAEAVADLTETFQRLLAEAEWRSGLGARAKQIIDANQGAAERTMKLIAPLFSAKQSGSTPSDSLLAANAHTS